MNDVTKHFTNERLSQIAWPNLYTELTDTQAEAFTLTGLTDLVTGINKLSGNTLRISSIDGEQRKIVFSFDNGFPAMSVRYSCGEYFVSAWVITGGLTQVLRSKNSRGLIKKLAEDRSKKSYSRNASVNSVRNMGPSFEAWLETVQSRGRRIVDERVRDICNRINDLYILPTSMNINPLAVYALSKIYKDDSERHRLTVSELAELEACFSATQGYKLALDKRIEAYQSMFNTEKWMLSVARDGQVVYRKLRLIEDPTLHTMGYVMSNRPVGTFDWLTEWRYAKTYNSICESDKSSILSSMTTAKAMLSGENATLHWGIGNFIDPLSLVPVISTLINADVGAYYSSRENSIGHASWMLVDA